jgi:integrase
VNRCSPWASIPTSPFPKLTSGVAMRGVFSPAASIRELSAAPFARHSWPGLSPRRGVGLRRTRHHRRSARTIESPLVEHHTSITEPLRVGALLRAIDAYNGRPETRCALLLAPLVFVRPGELRSAEWEHVDFEESKLDRAQ